MSYREYQRSLAPPWLLKPPGKGYLEGMGASKDALVALFVGALTERALLYGGDEALNYLGLERGIRRAPGEGTDAYRERLIKAWDKWRWGGTIRGLKTALETAGYVVSITEHFYRDNNLDYGEFSIVLQPKSGVFTTDKWGDGGTWNDGTAWAYVLGALEPGRIMRIIDETKAAHSKPRSVIYELGNPVDYWGTPDGSLWGDGTRWYGFDSVIVYP